ncbi:hypothetical protein FH972_023064 [Carpinus fangiana]|uniref:Uncharacterized protein n=1 Tax=Carpinus fangiana TaxID=176857 RepID=A0A5N6KUD2_9ROSI|nr:hypothetical protein FH972_023064 [Carpinus fangiana]
MSLETGSLPLSPASCYDNPSNLDLFNADPDIAGIGILVSFLVSAWIAWSLTLAAYISGTIPAQLLNPCDRRLFRVKPRASAPWTLTIEPLVLLLSDQQLITGVAILVAAFARFESINVLHWQFVAATAWMSSMTHLTTLTLLRKFFQNRPRLRNWRFLGMAILLALLLVAKVPSMSAEYIAVVYNASLPWEPGYGLGDGPAVNIRCMWPFRGSASSSFHADEIIAILFLVLSYIWKTVLLFQVSETATKVWLRFKIQNRCEKLLADRAVSLARNDKDPKQDGWLSCLAVTYIGLLGMFDFMESFAFSIFWLTVGLVHGTTRLVSLKGAANSQPTLEGGESSWSFGQIVPLCMLVMPVMTAFELYEQFRQHKGGSTDGLPPCTTASVHQRSSEDVHLRRRFVDEAMTRQPFESNINLDNSPAPLSRDMPSTHLVRDRTTKSDQITIEMQDISDHEAPPDHSESFRCSADIAIALAQYRQPIDGVNSTHESARLHRDMVIGMRRYTVTLGLITAAVASAALATLALSVSNYLTEDVWRLALAVLAGAVGGLLVLFIFALCWVFFKPHKMKIHERARYCKRGFHYIYHDRPDNAAANDPIMRRKEYAHPVVSSYKTYRTAKVSSDDRKNATTRRVL